MSCLGLNNSSEKNSLIKGYWCLNSRYKQPPVESHFSRLFSGVNTCMHRSTPLACAKSKDDQERWLAPHIVVLTE